MNVAITVAFFVSVLVLCVFGAGFVAHIAGHAEPEPSGAFDVPPRLVAVEPGVWVVRRYPAAIYHVDGYYWTQTRSLWFRARTWDGAWVHADASIVPASIVRRDPARYVYYEGYRGAPTRSLTGS